MANNRTILDLWIDLLRAELEQLVHVPATVHTTEDTASEARAYRSQLLLEGPVNGVMYVTVSASGMVQLAQMVAGEPIDPHAAWTEEGLEVWQIWLTAASGKLAAYFSEEFKESSPYACAIQLRDTTAVDGMHLTPGPDTAASGAATQQWRLQAGESEIAISVSVQVAFPGEETSLADAEIVPETSPSVEAAADEATASEASEVQADIPSPQLAPTPADDTPAPEPAPRNQPGPHAGPKPQAAPQVENRRASQTVTPTPEPGHKQRFELLLDVELETTLRFGALELPLREVLELGPGDVLPLDRHVREPVELVVGDRIVARGEVVLVGGNFALQVTEVAEPRRRLETIRCLF